jgi:hypothetical protein
MRLRNGAWPSIPAIQPTLSSPRTAPLIQGRAPGVTRGLALSPSLCGGLEIPARHWLAHYRRVGSNDLNRASHESISLGQVSIQELQASLRRNLPSFIIST